jgi:hypothetical protein
MTIEQIRARTEDARVELEACYAVVPTNYEEITELRERFDLANLRLEILRRTLDTYNFENEIKLSEFTAAQADAQIAAANNTQQEVG